MPRRQHQPVVSGTTCALLLPLPPTPAGRRAAGPHPLAPVRVGCSRTCLSLRFLSTISWPTSCPSRASPSDFDPAASSPCPSGRLRSRRCVLASASPHPGEQRAARRGKLAGSTDWRHRRQRLSGRLASTTPDDRQAPRSGAGRGCTARRVDQARPGDLNERL